MATAFVPSCLSPAELSADAVCVGVRGGEVLVAGGGGRLRLPLLRELARAGLEGREAHYLGRLGGVDCYAAPLGEEAPLPGGLTLVGLRAAMLSLEAELARLAGLGVQVVEWDRTHRFCGACGAATQPAAGERARRCPACGLWAYPRVAPAVIVRVTRGGEILLARGRRFPDAIYSVLAGFVDPGESLEEAARREVGEEVGIEIDRLAYFGSQPWPFPHSLMVAFTAEHAGGELRPDAAELVDAGWFGPDRLPSLPPPLSIARRMIDDFVASQA